MAFPLGSNYRTLNIDSSSEQQDYNLTHRKLEPGPRRRLFLFGLFPSDLSNENGIVPAYFGETGAATSRHSAVADQE